MPLQDLRPGGSASGTITDVNGQTGPSVNLTADDVGAVSASNYQEACPDNTTTQVVIGPYASVEKYVVEYVLKLNVSGKKHIGKIELGYDADEGAVMFDNEEGFVNSEISGLTIDGNESGGNLRISVGMNLVGENAKFRYTVSKIDQTV
jgi:hypothetical protein